MKSHSAMAALGVKAREYTPDEMRAARIQLGIEPAEAADAAEPAETQTSAAEAG